MPVQSAPVQRGVQAGLRAAAAKLQLLSEDRVVPLGEAAAIGGISASTLKRRAAAGDLKLIRMSPRRVGVRLSELNRWLEACSA
jgi:hypothetical protein